MAAGREPNAVIVKGKLLVKIKSTVDVLLASCNANVWSTYGGLSRIVGDLEKILRHGLKTHKNFFGEPIDYDVVLRDSGVTNSRITSGKLWLEKSLLEHCLTVHMKKLINNLQLMFFYYEDNAFLRSNEHYSTLLTCLQAVESNNPDLLTQLNNMSVNKEDYKLSSPRKAIILEAEENTVSKPVISEEKPYSSDSSKDVVNIDIEAREKIPLSSPVEFVDQEMLLAREKLHLQGLKLVEPRTRRHNIDQGTLAQVALSVVMESDERSTSPSSWFDGDNSLSRSRRSSSFTNVESSKHEQSCTTEIPVNDRTMSTDSSKVRTSDYQSKKAIGHTRSKSDGNSLVKTTKRQHSLKEVPHARETTITLSPDKHSRLSSSLPENSAEFYHNDPLSPSHGEQSLATRLALQDLTSCELDKENAHFSISEALIQAIEQMKCDEIVASEDEDEDDDEIRNLKLEIERRRIEKKREKLRVQPAFSDETSKSTSNPSSDPSRSTSSKSSILDPDDVSPDWEEISYTDDHVMALSALSASETTLVPENQETMDVLTVPGIECSTSPPLSAEAVAKSLLQKFANKKHPAASELQWLVSESDAPQSLLPLPQAYSVAPDDAAHDAHLVHERRASLPAFRIRGNLQWAPPRPQIIFHIHPAPRRKQLMDEQNYRCTGCGVEVDPGYMKSFRYCNYLGKYFCTSCHDSTLTVIPARVIRKWDFRKYEVSKFAMELLHQIHADPLYNIKDLNSSLYQRVRVLENIKNLRKQLYFLRTFAETCRKSIELQQIFSQIPHHILNEENLYSLQDLFQVKSGEMLIYFKSIVSKSLAHIEQCPLCQAKGFVCEYCRNGDDIIFPFQLDRAIQCFNCRASFHKDCYVKGKCPKCERIRIRKSLLAAPIATCDG